MTRDRDELTAATIMERGSLLAENLIDKHKAAWSSDTLTAEVRALDDRDLLCLSIVAMIDAPRFESYWHLESVCDGENERRNALTAPPCGLCEGTGEMVEVLTPGLHPADPARSVKEWVCPDCRGTGQAPQEAAA